MHPCTMRMEAWIGSAILVLSLVPTPASAQENTTPSGLRKAMQSLGRALTGPETQSAAERQDDEDAPPAAAKATEADQGATDTRKLSLVISQSKTITLPDFAKRGKI